MDTPRGYNPVGQSAPGLPHHDAPLPGHVPGTPSQLLGGADAPSPANGGFNTAYTGPGLPDWATKPFIRFAFFLWVYLTAPVEAALYPIAGAAGLVGAGLFYLLARMMGGGYDTTHGWAWTGCFLGVVALMRTETRLEDKIPGYLSARRWVRLALCFIFMFYMNAHDQGNSAGSSFMVAAVFTVIMHFVLRSKWLRFVWHVLQEASWMRTSMESPLPLKP
jgi:hypothetical protein